MTVAEGALQSASEVEKVWLFNKLAIKRRRLCQPFSESRNLIATRAILIDTFGTDDVSIVISF